MNIFKKNTVKIDLLIVLFILSLAIFVCYKNYLPNTFLTGWDTLHPEFDFSLNFNRVLNGVWRAEQGVGTLAAHSHMSELPRLIFLYIFSFFLPLHFLRYFFFFVMLSLGPIFTYFLLDDLLKNKMASLIGAIFYLFNLTVVQQFYVPFEMFAISYVAIPSVYLVTFRILNKKNNQKIFNKKLLFSLLVISFLFSSQAYAATLFYAFFGSIFLIILNYIIFNRFSKNALVKSLVILGIIISANFYWLTPNLYSIVNQSNFISESNINLNFSEEAFLRNKEYGNFKDLFLLKNFLFSWKAYDFQKAEFFPLLGEWANHLNNQYVFYAAIIIASISILGLIFSFINLNFVNDVFISLFFYSAFFLLNENPPLGFIYSFLRSNFSLFSEGFRNPYTKFSFIFLISYTFFIGIFFKYVFKYLNIYFSFLVAALFISLNLFYAKPFFEGQLISPLMRVAIPSEYFELNKWFKDKEYGRIAKFPNYTPWGWIYHNWGYQGAGFLWFGITQPQFDRDFDRWSYYNEQFFNEINFATYNNSIDQIDKILEKYDVRYLVYDKSIVNPQSNIQQVDIQKLFSDSKLFRKQNEFGNLIVFENLNFVREENSDVIKLFPFEYIDNKVSTKIGKREDKYFVSYNFDDSIFEKSQLYVPKFVELESKVPLEIVFNQNSSDLEMNIVFKTPLIEIDGNGVYQDKVEVKKTINNFDLNNIKYIALNNKIYDVSQNQKIRTYIDKSDVLVIKFFNKNYKLLNEEKNNLLKSDAFDCSEFDKKYQKIDVQNGFSLNNSENSICIGSDILSTNYGVFEVDFNYQSTINRPPFVCLTNSENNLCQNVVNYDFSINYSNDNFFEQIFLLDESKKDFRFSFVVPKSEDNSLGSFNYTDIVFKVFSLEESLDIDIENLLNDFSTDKLIDIKNAKNITVLFDSFDEYIEGFENRGYKSSYNCDIEKRGEEFKIILEKGFLYKAFNDAVSCDYFDFYDLSYKNAYIFNLSGQNINGRSLKFYMFNNKYGFSVLEKTVKKDSFDNFYFVPSFNLDGNGYVLNLENRSFGKVFSENILENISILPIPEIWLKNIFVKELGKEKVLKKVFNNKILFKEKLNSKYDGILLSQGYDKGWVALVSSNDQFSIFNFQFIRSQKVDSWKNGFLINSNICKNECNVIIFYIPQALQWIGFLALILTFMLILI